MFNPSAKLIDRLESVSSVLETGTAKDGSSLVTDVLITPTPTLSTSTI